MILDDPIKITVKGIIFFMERNVISEKIIVMLGGKLPDSSCLCVDDSYKSVCIKCRFNSIEMVRKMHLWDTVEICGELDFCTKNDGNEEFIIVNSKIIEKDEDVYET